MLGTPNTHVNHQREFCLCGGVRKGDPINPVAWLSVAGNKHHAMRMFTVREGDTQRTHASQSSCDAVDNCYRHAMGLQILNLFATTPKNKRIATLETHHTFTRKRFLHHQLLDKRLRCRLTTTTLAHVNDAR